MTEAEAKSKWCPFARLVSGDETPGGATISRDTAAAFNRVSVSNGDVVTTPHAAKCLGSACMAWRARGGPTRIENASNPDGPPEGDGWKPVPGQLRNIDWVRDVPGQSVGYCGLAGAPA